jgi:hypothetical protein
VDDSDNIWTRRWIRKGDTYTIEGLGIWEDGRPIVYLAEITDALDYEPRMRFYASRFRATVEIQTDISIFTKMLEQEGVGA